MKLGDWGECGYIDRTGKVVIPIEYSECREVGDSVFECVLMMKQAWTDVFDRNGKKLRTIETHLYPEPTRFLGVAYPHDVLVNGKHGWKDDKGNIIVQPLYDSIIRAWEAQELFRVERNKKWGYVGRNGIEYWKD